MGKISIFKIGTIVLFLGIIAIASIVYLNNKDPKDPIDNETTLNENTEKLEEENLGELEESTPITNMNDYIKTCIEKKLGKETNTNPSENKVISIKKTNSNSKEAYIIKIKADVNYNYEAVKGDILLDTKNFYKEFTKNKEALKNIDYITIIYNYNVINVNKVEAATDIMKITFKIDKINEIDWINTYSGDFPSMANEYWQHNILN